MKNFRLIALLLCLSCLTTSGCVSRKEKVFDHADMKTMKDIYNDHFGRTEYINAINGEKKDLDIGIIKKKDKENVDRTCQFANPSKYYQRCKGTRRFRTENDMSDTLKPIRYVEPIDHSEYTRNAQNELDLKFKEYPNPILSMYVYSHISDGNIPVPGYTTGFRMFKSTQFALPGELRE